MLTGSCLCGVVTFTADEPATDMKHCHCSMCRKTHGAPFATYTRVSGFQYTSGESSIASYASSAALTRHFCSHCGSVLGEGVEADGQCHIPAGLLDNDPGTRPTQHIFVESRADWFDIADDLPQINGYGPDSNLPEIDQPSRAGRSAADSTGGSCLCNAVQFQYSGTPEFMMYCHCSRCRKVKGAAHAANLFIKPEVLEWQSGEDNVTIYNHAEAVRFGNSFCKTCGSSVPRLAENSPVVNVPVGSLDDPPGVSARGHIYVGSKAPWYTISDSLPQFDEMPE